MGGLTMQQTTLTKIISGGQTGVDRGALDAALDNAFPCGGWCPSSRLAEDGRIPDKYPLAELKEGGYRQRTLRNIMESDGTVILYRSDIGGGTQETLLFCIKQEKPYKLIDGAEISADRAAELTQQFIATHQIRTLNVAGPRASNWPQGCDYTYTIMTAVIKNSLLSSSKRKN